MDLTDPVHSREQLVCDVSGLPAIGGQIEGAGTFGEDTGAVLDDAEVSHSLAGQCVSHLNSASSVGRSDLPTASRPATPGVRS